MADSIEFDASALTAAVSQMAEAYEKLSTEFDKVVSYSESMPANWKTPEGEAFISKFEAIRTGVSDFKSSYASITGFLTSSVSNSYVDAEDKIAAALAAASASGGN